VNREYPGIFPEMLRGCWEVGNKGDISHELIQGDFILFLGFPWPIMFKSERKNKTGKDLLHIETMLQNAKQLQHARLSRHVRYPSGIQFPCKCFPDEDGKIAETHWTKQN
jgi:hypothetical protein